jgi:hypothetical protein
MAIELLLDRLWELIDPVHPSSRRRSRKVEDQA